MVEEFSEACSRRDPPWPRQAPSVPPAPGLFSMTGLAHLAKRLVEHDARDNIGRVARGKLADHLNRPGGPFCDTAAEALAMSAAPASTP